MPAFDSSAQNRSPRSRSDGVSSRDYVPNVHPNLDYVFGSRTFSILQLKVGGSSRSSASRNPQLIDKRRAWLQTNYGLSLHSALVLAGRGRSDIRRIEDFVHGVIDSILLTNPGLLVKGTPHLKSVRRIVRQTLIVGTYSIGQLITYWKEFCSFLYNRFSGVQPQLPAPSRHNFYYTLMKDFPDVQRMLSGEVDKFLCEKFAHLTSTRHLAVGDRRAEAKSLEGFFATIERPYETTDSVRGLLLELAERVGEKTRAMPGVRATKPHISLSCAGSYYETVKDGGRGKEIRESLTSFLTVRPSFDETVQTPFGDQFCPKGEPRWRHWCRDEYYHHYPDTDFGEVINEEFILRNGEKVHVYYQGYDNAVGRQILVVSYLEYVKWSKTGLGIPCRVLTVPEPGYKARIVTTGPFWLTTLQQSLAHCVKTYLSAHPSARSSLMKTDQAWQSLYLMSGKSYPEGSSCLSSDLKEATDHIPKEVGILLLRGFLKGSGFKSNLVGVCLDILQMERTFIAPGYVSEKQTRGIMMGEPLTKGVLTILNLVVEEYAMRVYLKVPRGRSFYDSPPWRTYHVGGDDHLAVGPVEYLNKITECHLMAGSALSWGKHGISDRVVKYCEKVLEVQKILKGFNVRTINNSTEAYESSPFVDSVKVRLISPLSKAFDVSSDRNVAIGKGLSLGRSLKWMNRDHFSSKWIRMVRDRFFQRMGSLLPDRTSGLYWQLLLPPWWGGLDLYLPDEVELIKDKIPQLTLSTMEGCLRDDPTDRDTAKLLGKLLTNYSYRGYRLNESEVEMMHTYFEEVIVNLPCATWREIVQEHDPEGTLSAKDVELLAANNGWMGHDYAVDEFMRPLLFKEILRGVAKPKVYNTQRLKTRYSNLWNLRYRGPAGSMNLEDFQKIMKRRPHMDFYKVAFPEEFYFESDRGFTYKSILDDTRLGLPSLTLTYPFA